MCCVLLPVSLSRLRGSGESIRPAPLWAYLMLVQAWGGWGRGLCSGRLNHSTNAFIHLRNSAINFGADAGTFGEI